MKKIKLAMIALVAVCGIIPVSFASEPKEVFSSYCPNKGSITYNDDTLSAQSGTTKWLGTSTLRGGFKVSPLNQANLSIKDSFKIDDSVCYAHVSDGGHYDNTVIIFTVVY
jgi:hypothetical protein